MILLKLYTDITVGYRCVIVVTRFCITGMSLQLLASKPVSRVICHQTCLLQTILVSPAHCI